MDDDAIAAMVDVYSLLGVWINITKSDKVEGVIYCEKCAGTFLKIEMGVAHILHSTTNLREFGQMVTAGGFLRFAELLL